MISVLGVQTDGQTDTVLESSYGNMSAHKKFQLKAQNQELAVDRYMHPRMTGMHNENRDSSCIIFSKISETFTLLRHTRKKTWQTVCVIKRHYHIVTRDTQVPKKRSVTIATPRLYRTEISEYKLWFLYLHLQVLWILWNCLLQVKNVYLNVSLEKGVNYVNYLWLDGSIF